MMTRIVELLKEEKVSEKKLKPIELVYFVDVVNKQLTSPSSKLKSFDFVGLLAKNYYCGSYDLIKCWSEGTEEDYCLYFGHWNDGVVE